MIKAIETDPALWALALAKVEEIELSYRGQFRPSSRSSGMWAQNPAINVTVHLTLSSDEGEVLFCVITVRAPQRYMRHQDPSVEVQRFYGYQNDFWAMQAERDSQTRVVVNGTHYRLGPDRKDSGRDMKGFAGRRWEIEYLDGRPTVITNDLWYQGKIPEKYRVVLPDNARFL